MYTTLHSDKGIKKELMLKMSKHAIDTVDIEISTYILFDKI